MSKVVIIGGGLSGCAAAAAAAKVGASVTLLERMDLLGGCALVAGRVHKRHFCNREELRLMGGYDIHQVLDECTLHKDVWFPWPRPEGATITLYDVSRLDAELQKSLKYLGVDIGLTSRARGVRMAGKAIQAVVLDDGSVTEGDAFVDATGGAGGVAACQKYGNGCSMCLMRCPAFGDRVSIAAKAGVKELLGKKKDGSIGPITAGYSLLKASLSAELRAKLDKDGAASIPVPVELVNYQRTDAITASGNIDAGFAENVVLADIGPYAKRPAAGYTPLKELRKIPGLENVMYGDPYAGGVGNAVRYMAVTPRGEAMNVPGVDNLFVASEKTGINGLPEAIVTGVVAGHNAARSAAHVEPLVLPRTTIIGDFLAFINERWNTEEGLKTRFHLWTGPYLQRARETGVYSEDSEVIHSRIERAGLLNILAKRIPS